MPAVAGLGLVAIAFLVILLAFGARTLSQVLAQALSNLPAGIGNFIVRSQLELEVRILTTLSGWAGAATTPATNLIRRVTFFQWRLWDQAGTVAQATAVMGQTIVGSTIPRFFNLAQAFTVTVVQQAIHYSEALHDQVYNYATTITLQAIRYSEALHDQLYNYATTITLQAIRYSEALAAQAQLYAQQLAGQVTAYVQSLHLQSLDYARGLQAQALGFAEDAFGRAIEFERRLYGDAIRFAEQTGARAIDYARALAEQSNAYTATAVAAVAVRVLNLERSKCQRFCEPLGGLGSDLEDLSAVFEAGALFALAAAAAHDPQGWAREVVGDLSGPLREAAGAVLGETGVESRAA